MWLLSYLINYRLEFEFQTWTKDPTINTISTSKRILRAMDEITVNGTRVMGCHGESGLAVGRYRVWSSGRKKPRNRNLKSFSYKSEYEANVDCIYICPRIPRTSEIYMLFSTA